MRRIIEAAEHTLKRFGGRDIFETAENSGAKVWFRKLGGLKGFYICERGVRYIVINEDADEALKRVICAHELGHDMLHRELSAGGIRENTMFLDSNKTEREANLFAAQVLISDSEVLDEAEYCPSIDVLAYELGLPCEIVEYKLEVMNYLGHCFRLNEVRSDFLK